MKTGKKNDEKTEVKMTYINDIIGIICEIIVDRVKGAYLTPLITELSYNYGQKVDKDLKITSLG